MIQFARLDRLPPYVFATVNEIKMEARRADKDIIDLGMGNPDLETPRHIVDKLIEAAERLGLVLSGPHAAILIQGDDRLGALLDVHRKLADARINVYATSGVSSGKGYYGYVIHVRPEDVDNTAATLDAD